LPGSGIMQNYEEAARISTDLQTSAGRSLVRSLHSLAHTGAGTSESVATGGRAWFIFNPLPWKRTGVCELSGIGAGHVVALPGDATRIPQQPVPDRPNNLLVSLTVPACGYAMVRDIGTTESPAYAIPADKALANSSVSVRVDPRTGNLSSIVERTSGRELL